MGLHEKYLRPDGENESIKMIGAPSGSIVDRKPSIHEIVWIFFRRFLQSYLWLLFSWQKII
jgi:hypothetical protein